MTRRHDVICISSIDWDFIWQGHQEIMSRLAAGGHRVLFIENTGVRPPRVSDLAAARSRLRNCVGAPRASAKSGPTCSSTRRSCCRWPVLAHRAAGSTGSF